MTTPRQRQLLQLVYLEDDERDVLLLRRELERAGIDADLVTPTDEATFRDSLSGPPPDAILVDYRVPGFEGAAILDVATELQPDCPVIYVSGSIGEDRAIELLKRGATDYVLKGRLARLAPAIDRALEERTERRLRQDAESALNHRAQEQAAAAQLGMAALQESDFGELAALALERCAELYRAPLAIVLTSVGDRRMRVAASVGWPAANLSEENAAAILRSHAGLSLRTDETVVVTDIDDESRFAPSPYLAQLGVKSGMCTTIRNIEGVCGVLCVHDLVPREFDADQAHFLRTIAIILSGHLQRAQTVNALRASEKRYRTLCESSPVGIWGLSEDGTIEYANPALCEMLELSANETYGRPVQAFLAREDQTVFDVREPNAGMRATQCELELQGRSGRRRPALVSSARTAARGTPGVATIATVVDISSRRQAEHELRRALERYDVAVRGSTDGLWDWDLVTGEVYYSPRLCELLGFEEGGLRPTIDSLFAVVDPEDEPQLRDCIREHLVSGAQFDIEYRARHSSGDLRWFLARGSAIRDDSGKPIRLAGTISDVHRRRTLEEQLSQSQKMEAVGRLAGGVAHDFNNLLTVITGQGDLLRRELLQDGRDARRVDEVLEAGKRAAALTQQLLAFSRRQVLQLGVHDLGDIAAGIASMLQRLIGDDIVLHVDRGQSAGRIRADRHQIEQVIMNLAVNARDAMPSGGELRMETRNVDVSSEYARLHHEVEPGRYVVLTVGDTGVGMDEETQARIFEPFFTTKEAGKGTGLGLATVYGIVHQLGGFVWVYSEPGGGTTFKLYFRRVSDTVDDTVDTEPIEAYDPLGTESVLVVEDDPSVREAVQQMLELHGYRVVAAEDPDAAEVLTMASSEAFDLLLTDVVMPIRSGKELADRLRVLNPRLKVVFMSGYTDHEVVHRGVLDEGVMFIEKPFSADMLARVIRRTLGE